MAFWIVAMAESMNETRAKMKGKGKRQSNTRTRCISESAAKRAHVIGIISCLGQFSNLCD